MDLTTSFPRSVKEKIVGVVMVARTADKAKAKAHGNIGEYHYNCPMDVAVFTFLDIDHEKFLEAAGHGDAAIETFAHEHAAKKTASEIAEWNANFLQYAPAPGSDGEKYFLELRNTVAPDRTDVTAWADLLDLDEKREVAHKAGV